MKRLFVQESRIMFIKIMSMFLVLSIFVSALFVYVTYNGEKEILIDDCQDHFASFLNESLRYMAYEKLDKNNYLYCLDLNSLEYSINEFQSQSGKKVNCQAVILDNDNESIFETDNYFIGEFKWDLLEYGSKELDDEYISSSAYENSIIISYDDFIGTMDFIEKDEISKYLKEPEDSEGRYYELICTEFYFETEPEFVIDDGYRAIEYGWNIRIIPKTLQVVRTQRDHDWYVQDEVVAEYSLSVDSSIENTHRYTGGQTDTKRNIIDKDFFLGNYENDDLYTELCQTLDDNWIDYNGDWGNDIGSAGEYFQVSPFEYIYCGYENSKGIYRTDESKKVSSADLQFVKIRYFEKFNVFDSCISRIGMTFIYTFILLFIVGFVVWLISQNALKKQLELEKKRRDFTNSMAHDLKTPLFVISGNAENLLLCATGESEKYYAQNVVDKVNSVNDMVHDMLELSSLESGKIRVCTEHFNLSDLVQSIVDNYISMMDLCDIHIECAEGVMIDADKTMLKRAMQNLIDNALKYTNDKSSISIRLDSHCFSISNSVQNDLKINLKSIWEPYYRNENTAGKEGNGLGLTIVKSVFELNDLKYGVKLKNNIITFWYSF